MKVGITGGIGSGKSTVCRLFAERGIAVYDSDSEAKRLMQCDPGLRRALVARFGPGAYSGDALDRAYLAQRVFSDPAARQALNAAVHPAVADDFRAWAQRQTGPYVLFECALLFDAGLESLVDRTVAVLAPAAVRIERACRRDGCSPDAVRRRIAAQLDDDTLRARADRCIVNLLESDLRPAVDELDRLFRHEAAAL